MPSDSADIQLPVDSPNFASKLPEPKSFTFPASAPALEPKPTLSVKIGQPAEGLTLPRKALVIVTAQASQPGAAQLFVNDELKGELASAPYAFSLQTSAIPGDLHLVVKVQTAEGQSAEDEIVCQL